MGEISVEPSVLASAGASIEGNAARLDEAVVAVNSVGELSDPVLTGLALAELRSRWSAGATQLQEDIELLGRATQGASTLYTETDASAMGAG